jgi:hypothetical protein
MTHGKQTRENDGRYTFGNLDLACRCGHRLGTHAAERSCGEQPCFADDCDCGVFKKAKKG